MLQDCLHHVQLKASSKGKVERGVGYVRQNFWVRVCPAVESGVMELPELNEQARIWTAEVAHRRVHGTHGEVVAVRLAEEIPLLRRLDARPRYDVSYQSLRRVGRDGRLSYRGQVYQVSVRHALTVVEVRESVHGQITIQTVEGATVLATAITRDGQPPVVDQGRRALLDPPTVEQRDLAVYEEVAHAARHG